MAEGIPGSGNAGGASLCLDMDVGPLARAVQVASEDISPEDMKNLSDPSFRASAARWRSGPQTRKVTAAFARLLSSLSAIKPDCFKRTVEKENSGEMPVVEALPMTEVARKNPTSWKWFCGSTNGMATWVAGHWRTLWVLILMLCFPKLVAMLVAMLIRLIIRLMMALVMRVVREVAFELGDVMLHLSQLTANVELVLMGQLENMVHDWVPSMMAPSAPTQSQHGSGHPPMAPGGTMNGGDLGQPAPPIPPSNFFTPLLLLVNLVLQLRTHRQGGLGNV